MIFTFHNILIVIQRVNNIKGGEEVIVLTYESYANKVLGLYEKDEINRKQIAKTTTGLLLEFATLASSVGYLVSCVTKWGTAIGLILFVVLSYCMLDFVSEDRVVFDRCRKWAKFCPLFMILGVVAIGAMRTFWK